jgi:hypothetical protein
LPTKHAGLELHGAHIGTAQKILNGTWAFPEAQPDKINAQID